MSVTFAEKLARIPNYSPGTSLDDARARSGVGDAVKLASNESPFPPHPAVVEAIAEAAKGLNLYPDPSSTLLRARIADRLEVEPARITIGNGSCELLLAAAEALCEPGDELVFAWPSFSIYPYLAPLTGAREVRVPLDDAERHDLAAMEAEVTAATKIVMVCNPNNPTGTYLGVDELAAFMERIPSHVTVVLDEAYVEYQTRDDPQASIELVERFANLALMRTFSKCYGLAGARVGYALCSPALREAMDAVRQPFPINSLAQAGAAEAILHQDDVVRRVEGNLVERLHVDESLREMGFWVAEGEANFVWLRLGDHAEDEVVAALDEAGVAVRPGSALGAPGHLRVTYGTRADNDRFLSALAAAI